MSLIGRRRTFSMTASSQAIERLHWQSFLSTCGYEARVKVDKDSRQTLSMKRHGTQYDFDVNSVSPNSIELTGTEVCFTIARLLGCLRFRLHPDNSENVAFEIFEIKLVEGLFRKLGNLVTSVKPDTDTPETSEIIELVYKCAPNLLLPAKSKYRTRNVFGHFAIIGSVQFIAVSSDRYNDEDWRAIEQFDAIRRTIEEFGGYPLEFLRI